MNIIAVDDERISLLGLERTIREAVPQGRVTSFMLSTEALEYARENMVDVAFLDVEMPELTGLELALRLKGINPRINIVFVTGYADYMGHALKMHVSGYVLKPAKAQDILRELENLRYPVARREPFKRVRMKCFGAFEMFVDEKPFIFSRSKGKELLAYLVDRKGEGATASEIGSLLWEEKKYTRSIQKQVQTIISLLMRSLREAGIEDIIVKERNYMALDVEKVDCDYFDYLRGDMKALNSYAGEYLSNYSWAEITTAELTYKSLR